MTNIKYNDMLRQGLSYDDVLLVPQYSEVISRNSIDIGSALSDEIKLTLPLISAPMDTVTDFFMCMEMDRLGGLGILHRFQKSFEAGNTIDQFRHQRPDGTIGASIGVTGDYLKIA